MRKLITLLLLVTLSSNGYSQKDTPTNIDTTIVVLPTKVARLVYQDLLRYDGAKLEIGELNKTILLKDKQISFFKEKDTLKTEKIENLQLIITKKDEQFSFEKEKSNSLRKELKGQQFQTRFYKVIFITGTLLSAFILIK
jgi:hypothetical protein